MGTEAAAATKTCVHFCLADNELRFLPGCRLSHSMSDFNLHFLFSQRTDPLTARCPPYVQDGDDGDSGVLVDFLGESADD